MAEQKATKKETKKEFMLESELTLIQQTALEGEVALVMYRANTETEELIGAYTILACCEEKYLYLYKQELTKYFDEVIVDELVRYRYTEILPVHLFVDRMVDILKGMQGHDCGSLRVLEFPNEVIKNKFVVGIREISKYIPNLVGIFLDALLNKLDDELEFLVPLIFVLKEALEENPAEKDIGVDGKIKLLSLDVDKLPVMDLPSEDDRLKVMNEMDGLTQQEKIEHCMKKLFGVSDELKTVKEQDNQENQVTVYKVKKINKTNGMVVFEKEFGSRKEATEYVKQIVTDYPELTKQYNFAVELSSKSV